MPSEHRGFNSIKSCLYTSQQSA